MNERHQGLWDFALKLYAAPGVADACLVLQDESGVDVPVLLFAAWLSKNGVPLTDVDVARIDGLVADWRNEVVRPLRTIRRRLKTGPRPAPTPETDTLRNGIKGLELGAEKIELAVLEAEGEMLIAAAGPGRDGNHNLLQVVRHYHRAEPGNRLAEALTVIENVLAAS